MPYEVAVALALVAVPFAVFGFALAYGDYQTNHRPD